MSPDTKRKTENKAAAHINKARKHERGSLNNKGKSTIISRSSAMDKRINLSHKSGISQRAIIKEPGDNHRKLYDDSKIKAGSKNAAKKRASSTGYEGNASTGKQSNLSDRQNIAGSRQNIEGGRQKAESFRQNVKNDVMNSGCKYIKECGGCNYQKESYEAELIRKQKLVNELLSSYCRVEPIIGMEKPDNYRNKVHVVFDHDKKSNPISGVYQEGTHHVIPIESCRIHNKKADEIIASIRGMLKSFKIKTYDEDTGYGLLRHVLIRTGYSSGEILVVLVLSSPILPSKNNFVKALLKQHPEISSIVINVNDKKTSMVLGDKEQVIYGKGYIIDQLCGKTFKISPKSFYQVNPVQTEILYNKAVEYANLTGNETVIDAYCGIGTIGLVAADHAKEVIGVELNKDAVRDAISNAKMNNASNIYFYNDDASDFMSGMAAEKRNADVVFLDPPRAGSTEKFLNALAALKPKKVVYVSCNPLTLERDLKYLTRKGYKVNRIQPVDMFPWTEHVETVVLMCASS